MLESGLEQKDSITWSGGIKNISIDDLENNWVLSCSNDPIMGRYSTENSVLRRVHGYL